MPGCKARNDFRETGANEVRLECFRRVSIRRRKSSCRMGDERIFLPGAFRN